MRDSHAEDHLNIPRGYTPVSSAAAAAAPSRTTCHEATRGCDDSAKSQTQRGGGEVMSRISKPPRRGQASDALHRRPARQDCCGGHCRREPLLGIGFGIHGWWTRVSAGTSVGCCVGRRRRCHSHYTPGL